MTLFPALKCSNRTTKGEDTEIDTIWLAVYSLMGFLCVALCGKIRYNVPARISSVPVTMHTFAINLLPTLLGSKISTLSAILYCLYLGILDYKYLYAPTAGYLVGFVVASALIGGMVEDTNFKHSNSNLAISMLMANVTILFCGMLYMPIGLAFKTGKTVSQFSDLPFLLNEAVIPFIPGAIIKIILALCTRSVISFLCC